jgi:hypothetical protein
VQFAFSGYAKKYPESYYQPVGSCNGITNGTVYFDDVSLNEGTGSTFAAANSLEVVVATGKPGNVFYSNESLLGTIRAYNTTGSAITNQEWNYEIRDDLLRVVSAGTLPLSASANSGTTTAFSFATGNRSGFFTLRYWREGHDQTDRELAYSIIPNYAVGPGVDPSSAMCVHATTYPHQLVVQQRLGFKTLRALSPTGFFRWEAAEPTEGGFRYFDSSIAAAQAAGFTIMGVLGSECSGGGCSSGLPTYGDDGTGKPDLTKWATFVSTIVNHYKNTVKLWEVWNEPSYTASFYADLLEVTIDAIQANDLDDTTIIAMGGRPASFMTNVFAALQPAYLTKFTVASTHNYFGGYPPENLIAIVDTYGYEIRNTESGVFDYGSYFGPNAQWYSPGKAIYPYNDAARFYTGLATSPTQIAEIFARTLSSKQSQYCLYDTRTVGPDSRNIQSQASTSGLEFDNSPSAKLVALAIGGSFLDHATRLGNKSPASNSQFLEFQQASGVPVAVLFSSDYLPRQVTLSGTASEYLLYDRFRNPIAFTGTVIPYGRNPVYLVGNGISGTTLGTRLSAGVIASRMDTAAPNVVIVDGPREATTGDNIRIRWIGMDDQSVPNLGEVNVEQGAPVEQANPSAILYSYCLETGSGCTFGNWLQDTFVDYSSISSMTGYFRVRAKDVAGNVSATVSLCVGPNCAATPPPQDSDTTAPVPGNSGTLTITRLTTKSVRLNWTAATDNVTSVANLQYAVYRSTKRVTSLAGAEASTLIANYANNITTYTATGLNSKSTYYFSVVVRDEAGNKAVYQFALRAGSRTTTVTAEPNTGFNTTTESGTFKKQPEPRK